MSLEPTSCGDCLVFVGLDDVRLVSLESNEHGLVMTIETTNQLVGCPACGVVARSKGRDRVELVDLPNFGRPTRTIWLKLSVYNIMCRAKYSLMCRSEKAASTC